MSKITELGEKYINLSKILDVYQQELEQAEEQLKISGKRLEIANSENSAWLHYYDQRKVELHTLVKFLKSEEDKVKSTLFRSYKENYSRALGEREINRYIDGEDLYIFTHSVLIEIEEMFEMYQCVVNAFTTRNYTLSNITKIRVASLENVEI